MITLTFNIRLPEVDEYNTPKEKLPNCPNCGEDELGMMGANNAVCYKCNSHILRYSPGLSITNLDLRCNNCPWIGRLSACEPGDEGELLCPQCLNEISVRVPNITK